MKRTCKFCSYQKVNECHLNPPVPVVIPRLDRDAAVEYRYPQVNPSALGCSHGRFVDVDEPSQSKGFLALAHTDA